MLTLATVVLDPPTTLFAGSLLALISMKLIARSPERELLRTGAYAGLWSVVYGVGVSFMFFLYPDWMFVYLRDAKEVPLIPVWIVFMITMVGCGVLGALGTGYLISRRRVGLAVATMLGALLLLLLLSWLQAAQYGVVGTYAQYTAGQAPTVLENKHAQLYMNLAAIIAAPVAIGLIVIRVVQTRRSTAAAQPSN